VRHIDRVFTQCSLLKYLPGMFRLPLGVCLQGLQDAALHTRYMCCTRAIMFAKPLPCTRVHRQVPFHPADNYQLCQCRTYPSAVLVARHGWDAARDFRPLLKAVRCAHACAALCWTTASPLATHVIAWSWRGGGGPGIIIMPLARIIYDCMGIQLQTF